MDQYVEEHEGSGVVDDLCHHVHKESSLAEDPQEVKQLEPQTKRSKRHKN